MTNDQFITVIIPTRNRCETLRHTLETCVSQRSDYLRIIVSDNCSTDDTRGIVESIHDSRLRYIRTPTRLSMTSNFEYSLQHSVNGYVGFIGDDDGLMPGAIDTIIKLIGETGTRAITSSSVFYTWPNFPLVPARNQAIIRSTGTAVTTRSAKEEIRKLVEFSGLEQDYVWGLPSVYRGFVHSDILAKAIIGGKYFNSVTPDAYSAFVNSFFLETYLYLDEPLTIEGVSGKSNGASQIFGQDKREEQSYLEENDIPFHDALVYAPSPPIILAEAYMSARKMFPQFCAGHDFSIERVCDAAMRYRYPGPNQERVALAVAQIRSKHRLSEVTHARRDLRSSIARYVRQIRKDIQSLEVDCGAFGAYDVSSASRVVAALLQMRHDSSAVRGGLSILGSRLAAKLKRQLKRTHPANP